jgi:hypothetical protein
VPNFPLVRAWAQSKADASLDAALDDPPALCAHPAVKRFARHTAHTAHTHLCNADVATAIGNSYVVHELYRIGAKAGIQSFEFVRGVHLETEQFTIDNGLLTGFLPSPAHAFCIPRTHRLSMCVSCRVVWCVCHVRRVVSCVVCRVCCVASCRVSCVSCVVWCVSNHAGPQKLKRQALNDKYASIMDQLYGELDDPIVMQQTLLSMLGTLCFHVSCRILCRVVSCRVVSCRVVSCRVVSCRVVSCRVVSHVLCASCM